MEKYEIYITFKNVQNKEDLFNFIKMILGDYVRYFIYTEEKDTLTMLASASNVNSLIFNRLKDRLSQHRSAVI